MTAWCTPRPRIALAVAVALAAASAAGRLRGARGEVGGVSPGEARAARARQVAADARTPPRNVAANAVAREALPEACHATPNLDLGGPALSWGLTFKTETAAECCQACADKPPTRRGYRCMHWTWCPGGDGEWASECFAPDIHNHTKVRACVRACVRAAVRQTNGGWMRRQAHRHAGRQGEKASRAGKPLAAGRWLLAARCWLLAGRGGVGWDLLLLPAAALCCCLSSDWCWFHVRC